MKNKIAALSLVSLLALTGCVKNKVWEEVSFEDFVNLTKGNLKDPRLNTKMVLSYEFIVDSTDQEEPVKTTGIYHMSFQEEREDDRVFKHDDNYSEEVLPRDLEFEFIRTLKNILKNFDRFDRNDYDQTTFYVSKDSYRMLQASEIYEETFTASLVYDATFDLTGLPIDGLLDIYNSYTREGSEDLIEKRTTFNYTCEF